MRLFWVGILALYSPLLLAEADPPRADAQIQASGQAYNGQLMLNQAAGNGIQQANGRTIALGTGTQATVELEQRRGAIPSKAMDISASARIRGAAFSQGRGVLGINQSAGTGNQSSNGFRLVWGTLPDPLEDSMLSHNAAPLTNSEAAVPHRGERLVETDDQAFAASRGVVQLNQSAGIGNYSANRLSIRVVE
ncbi:MAG: adhesin [Pseudomonadota bacterium]